MPGSERRWLRDSLRAFLLPAFERLGFQVVPLSKEDASSRAISSAFPFGSLRRQSEHGLEIVEIQLDKRQRPTFRINMGIAPPEGVEHPIAGHISQGDLDVHSLRQSFELYQIAFIRRWFSARSYFGRAPSESDYEELAKRVVGLIPEVEATLREGTKRGRHVRSVVRWR